MTSRHLKGVFLGYVIDDLVPNSFGHIFAHRYLLLILRGDFAHFSKTSSFCSHFSVSERFLLDQKIQVVIRLQARRTIASRVMMFLFLLLVFLFFFFLLVTLLLLIFHRRLHEFQTQFLVLLFFFILCLMSLFLHFAAQFGLQL